MSKMTSKQQAKCATYLENFASEVRLGNVEWFAITVKFPKVRVTIHTEYAPKRPKGIS